MKRSPRLPLNLLLLFAVLSTISSARADLLAVDFSSGFLHRFSLSGARTTYTADLNGAEGLAFDANGNFFVSETGTGRILKFLTDGTQTTFATGLNGPASLVFDAAGNLFDADFFGGIIYRFTPDGTRTTFATGLSGPANLAFDAAGNLFEADFNTGNIFRFTAAGARSTFASGTGRPHGLAFDAAGNLFVADFESGTIYRFTPAAVRTVFATGLNGPHGIVFDDSGNLFTADYNTGTIYRFTPAGVRTTFATGMVNPANLIFTPVRPSANNLLNISTRAFVGTDTGVLIGGFILQGANPSTLVIRAIGPSLTTRGISNALANPSLELFNASGAMLFSNDNWQSDANAAAIQRVGLAPEHANEAALRVALPAGAYTAVVRGPGGSSGIGLVEIFDLQQNNSRSANISTRGTVLSGEGVMIAGCIIGGTTAKDVVVRAIGPSLRPRGVADALANPRLEVINANGVSVGANDDWQTSANAAMIEARGLAPESPLESALLVNLAPGAYTAIESPAPQDSGVGLVEIYDLSPQAAPAR